MDGIIDIIILVLLGVVPAIFKAIGNKLEKSGKTDKARKFKKAAENFEDYKKPIEIEEEDLSGEEQSWGDIWKEVREDVKKQWTLESDSVEPAPEVIMVPTSPKPMKEDVVSQIKATKRPEAIKSTKRKPMMLIEDEPKKQGERIDPRKLVIYSEIMKTKF